MKTIFFYYRSSLIILMLALMVYAMDFFQDKKLVVLFIYAFYLFLFNNLEYFYSRHILNDKKRIIIWFGYLLPAYIFVFFIDLRDDSSIISSFLDTTIYLGYEITAYLSYRAAEEKLKNKQ